jgi:hypothetical protein
MKILTRTIIIPCFLTAALAASCSSSQDLSGLDPYLKKSTTFRCKNLNREIPVNIYYSGDSTGSEGTDVVLYLKNKAWERIGQEPDLSILSDLIRKKFIVLTADFGRDPEAVSPFIDNDINDIYSAVFGFKTQSLLKDINLVPNRFRCFILPEGYRVETNLTYWEMDKHGVYGTLEYILKTYNEEIVPKVPGKKPAETPAEMVDRKGNPFDYRIKMDILYPSQPKKKLPAFVYSETSQYRNAHIEAYTEAHVNYYQLRGYVYVVMGHCFNPCVTHYWHFINFTLDHWNGLACYTAALRYIYMNAEKYSINTDHIGVMGISKGQYAVTRLSDPNHAGGTESKKFEGFPDGTPEPQPWQGYPSTISAGWQGMGMGLWETEYITPDYVPTILACGENDRDVITKEGYPKFKKRLEELDVNHLSLFMTGLGHSQSWGYDKVLGVDRYQLVIDFFDRYLKVEDKLPPVVLMVFPRDSAENVSPDSEIEVYFAPEIDEKTILDNKGIRINRLSDNKEVGGTWSASGHGTKFTFKPGQILGNNEIYEVVISTRIKDRRNIHLDKKRTIRFRTGV